MGPGPWAAGGCALLTAIRPFYPSQGGEWEGPGAPGASAVPTFFPLRPTPLSKPSLLCRVSAFPTLHRNHLPVADLPKGSTDVELRFQPFSGPA